MAPKYITGDDLAVLIKSKEATKDYLVVDVRDSDYAGGNILHAVNTPSRTYHFSVDQLAKRIRDENIDKVIFHCAMSEVRGPKAARIFDEIYAKTKSTTDHTPEILILQGGFTQFQAKFKDDPLLVENWDKDVWDPEWS